MANKDKTLIVFIIDRSGSMEGLQKATIEGFNTMMKEQRNAAGEALATVILFDDRYEVLYDKINVKQIPDLDDTINLARGTTALRDAIGQTILNVSDWLTQIDEDDRPGKVLFSITTDGYDNRSNDYDSEKIKDMITFKRKVDKWEFIFTGANEELVATAQSYGIAKGNTTIYENTSIGAKMSYLKMSGAVTSYRAMDTSNFSGKCSTENLFKEDS